MWPIAFLFTQQRLGIDLRNISRRAGRITVQKVSPDTEAAQQVLLVGDVLTHVGNKAVADDGSDFAAVTKMIAGSQRPLVLAFDRPGAMDTVSSTPAPVPVRESKANAPMNLGPSSMPQTEALYTSDPVPPKPDASPPVQHTSAPVPPTPAVPPPMPVDGHTSDPVPPMPAVPPPMPLAKSETSDSGSDFSDSDDDAPPPPLPPVPSGAPRISDSDDIL